MMKNHPAKILHLRASTSFGGAEKLMLSCFKKMKQEDFSLFLLGIVKKKRENSSIVEKARESGIASFYLYYRWKFGIYSVFSLVSFLKKNQITIVHSHGYRENILVFFSSWLCDVWKISTVHGWTTHGWRKRIDKIILKRFDIITVPSEEIVDELIQAGIKKEKITLLRNVIDPEALEDRSQSLSFRKEFNIPQDMFTVTYIGRISPEKGLHYLLESASHVKEKIPGIKIVIAGDGTELDILKNHVRKTGLENHVIFTGYREDVGSILRASDVFVNPSLTEGFPLSILEAMYCKVPVVATAVGGIPEIMKTGESGILIEPRNSEELADALVMLFKDSKARERISQNAYRIVTQEYLIDNYCIKLKEVYNRTYS